MTSSLPLDQELEIFGWSEDLITSNLFGSYHSIVDNTMCFAILMIINIYCLLEILLDLIINYLNKKIFIPRISLFNLREFFVLPRLITK